MHGTMLAAAATKQARSRNFIGPGFILLIWLACQLIAPPAIARLNTETLFLEVFINSQSTKLIAEFSRTNNGVISTKIDELKQLGIKCPREICDQQAQSSIPLNSIKTLAYTYDETRQILNITLDNQQRLATEYFPRKKSESPDLPPPELGAVLNYSVFASSGNLQFNQPKFSQTSTSLDGWVYGPAGNIYGSAIIASNGFGDFKSLRLDSGWAYSNPKNLTEIKVGDIISGGLSWTRPIRMGGIQFRKSFGLRPDLITTPLFNATGSAAVPSTVDVYLGSFKAHSQKVDAGRFSINQVPSVSGQGNARIVITDATGREQIANKPFYISSKLLRPGMFDYSTETGLARLNYGAISNDYTDQLFSSGTFRYGLTNQVTLEGHAEYGGGLINAGLGTSFTLAHRALLSLSGATSLHNNSTGYQLYGSFETQIGGINIHASTRRVLGNYRDLAAISEKFALSGNDISPFETPRINQKVLDQISIGLPLPSLNAGLNLSFTHLKDVVSKASNTVSVSYSQKIFKTASLSLSAYSSMDSVADIGAYLNLSFPLGKQIFASAGLNSNAADIGVETTVSKFSEQKPGSVGWNLSQSNSKSTRRSASVNYRGKYSNTHLELHQNDSDFTANAYMNGAIVGTSSGVFLSNRIDDAFAVVETGTPDVPVFLANNRVGVTNRFGDLLVPGLSSYEENALRIDPVNLPVNTSLSHTQQTIVPSKKSGVKVPFNVETKASSAVVIFKNAADKYIQVGSIVELIDAEGRTKEASIVGYDGRAFLENLGPANEVVITTPNGKCSTNFNYAPKPAQQVEIGPIVCRN